MRDQLDHQMADALALGREMTAPSGSYPDPVWRAMRLAYAMHYRVLLEFFHDGRAALTPRGMTPKKNDIIVSDVLPPGASLAIKPTSADKKRFRMADKLAAHLTRERTWYLAASQEWGSPGDRKAIRARIERLMGCQAHTADWFPCTRNELAKP